MLRKDIFSLLEYARSKKFIEIRLNTNGMLVTKESVKKLEKYVDNVLVPLNSWSNEEESKCTGAENALDQRTDALRLLRNSKIKIVRSGTIATPENISHLDEIFNIVKSLGLDSWEVYRPISNSKETKQLSKEEIKALVAKLKTFKEEGWFVPIANALPFCSFDMAEVDKVSLGAKYDDGHCRIVVDARGYAKPSYFIDEPIGDPEDIGSCWNNEFMRKLRELKLVDTKCKNCTYLLKCKGGSRFAANLVNSNYDKRDPLAG